MIAPLLRIPIGVGPAVALSSLFLWFLVNCFEADIAASREALRIAVEQPGWQPQWPVLPWLLAVSAVLLTWVRSQRAGAESRLDLHLRLHRLSLLWLGLVALRVASLWNPLLLLFPYLSLLWTPHATWALSLATCIWLPMGPRHPGRSRWSSRSPGRIALLLFAISALLYGAYTLYFCQVTMLHGDEGQYLRVTQSLVHDGDMDLSNNLEAGQALEFHTRAFGVHAAPASPEGKVYSVHPVGLSVLLAPAYWTGLHLWANPRLAAALMMALLSAGCVARSWLWLSRLGMGGWESLLSVGVMGSTIPFVAYASPANTPVQSAQTILGRNRYFPSAIRNPRMKKASRDSWM